MQFMWLSIVMLESCFRQLRLFVLGSYKINKEGDNLGSGKIFPVVLVTSRSGIECSMQNDKITPSPAWAYLTPWFYLPIKITTILPVINLFLLDTHNTFCWKRNYHFSWIRTFQQEELSKLHLTLPYSSIQRLETDRI